MKANQDAYILSPNLNRAPAMHMFGIADGHGQYGNDVANYVKQALPWILCE